MYDDNLAAFQNPLNSFLGKFFKPNQTPEQQTAQIGGNQSMAGGGNREAAGQQPGTPGSMPLNPGPANASGQAAGNLERFTTPSFNGSAPPTTPVQGYNINGVAPANGNQGLLQKIMGIGHSAPTQQPGPQQMPQGGGQGGGGLLGMFKGLMNHGQSPAQAASASGGREAAQMGAQSFGGVMPTLQQGQSQPPQGEAPPPAQGQPAQQPQGQPGQQPYPAEDPMMAKLRDSLMTGQIDPQKYADDRWSQVGTGQKILQALHGMFSGGGLAGAVQSYQGVPERAGYQQQAIGLNNARLKQFQDLASVQKQINDERNQRAQFGINQQKANTGEEKVQNTNTFQTGKIENGAAGVEQRREAATGRNEAFNNKNVITGLGMLPKLTGGSQVPGKAAGIMGLDPNYRTPERPNNAITTDSQGNVYRVDKNGPAGLVPGAKGKTPKASRGGGGGSKAGTLPAGVVKSQAAQGIAAGQEKTLRDDTIKELTQEKQANAASGNTEAAQRPITNEAIMQRMEEKRAQNAKSPQTKQAVTEAYGNYQRKANRAKGKVTVEP